MAQSKINAHEQLKPNSVTSAEVDSSVLVAAGTNAMTGNLAMGGNRVTGAAQAQASNDLITLAQAQALLLGLSTKTTVVAATTGAETFTIASGSVTQINGTTIDGVTPAVGDPILVKNAPAASGVGSADSAGGAGTDNPANGIYTVTGNTTNLTLARASNMSGTNMPAGVYALIEAGTANKAVGYIVTDPASPDTAFTYGTNNIQWQKFTGGGGSVTNVSVATANGFNGSVVNPSTTPAISVGTSVTGIMKGSGGAAVAATAGTDYLGPSNRVQNETPSGTINGTNTGFTLANTPNANVVNPVDLYLNGVLLEPGSGNDYTLSGTAITMLFAPATGDKLRANYWK